MEAAIAGAVFVSWEIPNPLADNNGRPYVITLIGSCLQCQEVSGEWRKASATAMPSMSA